MSHHSFSGALKSPTSLEPSPFNGEHGWIDRLFWLEVNWKLGRWMSWPPAGSLENFIGGVFVGTKLFLRRFGELRPR